MIRASDQQPTRASFWAERLARSVERDLADRNAIKISEDILTVPADGKVSPLAWGRPCIAEKIGQGISLPDVAKEIVASRLTASDEAEEKRMCSAITVGEYVPSLRRLVRHRLELPKEGAEFDVSAPERPVLEARRSAI